MAGAELTPNPSPSPDQNRTPDLSIETLRTGGTLPITAPAREAFNASLDHLTQFYRALCLLESPDHVIEIDTKLRQFAPSSTDEVFDRVLVNVSGIVSGFNRMEIQASLNQQVIYGAALQAYVLDCGPEVTVRWPEAHDTSVYLSSRDTPTELNVFSGEELGEFALVPTPRSLDFGIVVAALSGRIATPDDALISIQLRKGEFSWVLRLSSTVPSVEISDGTTSSKRAAMNNDLLAAGHCLQQIVTLVRERSGIHD